MNYQFLPPELSAERVVACFGLISDTHMPQRWPQIPAPVFEIFRGVDLVFHAGDVGQLWALDRLSAIAPIVAVHGNDETAEAQRELPYQQIVATGGHRLLLCHGHLPDREAEMASRAGDDWSPKLAQRARQARAAGAAIMVFGHLHIPFIRRFEDVWLINPGAIASGSVFTRQTRQTIALLYLRDDGRPFVTHIDLADPNRAYAPSVEWEAGFAAAANRYSESIVRPEVAQVVAALRRSRFFHDRRLWVSLSRPGMARWLGKREPIAVGELRDAIDGDAAFAADERAELLALIDGSRPYPAAQLGSPSSSAALKSLPDSIGPPDRLYDGYIFDLDGTIYLGDALLPTVADTITRLRSLGKKTIFLSNNPTNTADAYAAKLTRLGLPTPPEDVINSSRVMVEFLTGRLPGARLFVVGEAPLCRELAAAGFELTDDPRHVQVVIASFDRTFDYRKLQIAFDALRAGARFFATNADRFCPVPGGGQPDAAAVLAALTACTGVEVEAVVGKPSRHMAGAALRVLAIPPERCIMVGDRLETDVRMALEAGMTAALALTGATDETALARSEIRPTFVLHRLAELIPTNKVHHDPMGIFDTGVRPG
jgi:NagD protein